MVRHIHMLVNYITRIYWRNLISDGFFSAIRISMFFYQDLNFGNLHTILSSFSNWLSMPNAIILQNCYCLSRNYVESSKNQEPNLLNLRILGILTLISKQRAPVGSLHLCKHNFLGRFYIGWSTFCLFPFVLKVRKWFFRKSWSIKTWFFFFPFPHINKNIGSWVPLFLS